MFNVQLGTVGEWAGALATAAVAVVGGLYVRSDRRSADAQRVLVDRVAPDDWTDPADTKTRIAIQNLTDQPIWNVVVIQSWVSGKPVHVHKDKDCWEIPEGRREERIGLKSFHPDARDGWVTFGASRENTDDDPPVFGAARVYWADGSGKRWVARPGEQPTAVPPGDDPVMPCLPM